MYSQNNDKTVCLVVLAVVDVAIIVVDVNAVINVAVIDAVVVADVVDAAVIFCVVVVFGVAVWIHRAGSSKQVRERGEAVVFVLRKGKLLPFKRSFPKVSVPL